VQQPAPQPEPEPEAAAPEPEAAAPDLEAAAPAPEANAPGDETSPAPAPEPAAPPVSAVAAPSDPETATTPDEALELLTAAEHAPATAAPKAAFASVAGPDPEPEPEPAAPAPAASPVGQSWRDAHPEEDAVPVGLASGARPPTRPGTGSRAPTETSLGTAPAPTAAAERPAAGSLGDLRARLARLPAGHPSSPYDDAGRLRPAPTRLRMLELGLPARPAGTNYAGRAGFDHDHDSDDLRPAATAATTVSPPASPAGPSDTPHRSADRDAATPAAVSEASNPESARTPSSAGRVNSNGSLADVGSAAEDAGPPRNQAGATNGDGARPESDQSRRSTAGTGESRADQAGTGEPSASDQNGHRGHSAPPGWHRSYEVPGDSEHSSDGSEPVRRTDPTAAPWPAVDVSPATADNAAARPSAGQHLSGPVAADRLSPEQQKVVDRILAACRAAEGRDAVGGYGSRGLTPAMRRIAAQLPFGGLAPGSEADTLKSADEVAGKLARLLARQPGRPAEQVAASIGDAIRYAFAFDAASYTECTLLVHRKLKTQGFELETRRNLWDSPEHKGVFTRWRDPAHDLPFEVQFHSDESWALLRQTREAYLRITDPATSPTERARLRAEQATAAEVVQQPPGWTDIADFHTAALAAASLASEAEYYVIVAAPSGRAAGLARRAVTESGPVDETLGLDLNWQPDSAIAEWEYGDLGSELVRISEQEAENLTQAFRTRLRRA
jgi:hypothetical protein